MNNGWRITDISGENCASDGSYEAGPGLTTTCNFTYDYVYPYPSVIAANTNDMHIVRTVIVRGGDLSAQKAATDNIYDAISSVFGGQLATDDITDADDVYRVVGSSLRGCGKSGCSYGGATGKIDIATV